MADLIQLRRDTAANWTSANPTLSQGEQGYETDTGKMKIGDGSTAWTSLAYFVDSSAYATSSDITSAVSTKANTADLATVATTGAYADVTGTPTLATVATSGSYDDLSDQPTIPSIDGLATETYVDTAVSNLVDTAPAALDTLNELAAALGDDADFASTVTTSLAAKANSADLATVATSGSYNDLSDQPTIPADVSDLTDTTSLLGSGGGGGGSFEAVASGSLSDGSTSILNADGTVSAVGEVETPGSLGTDYSSAPDGSGHDRQITMYDSTSGKTVTVAHGGYPSYEGTISLTTFNANGSSSYTPISFPAGFDSGYYRYTAMISIGNGKFVLSYYSTANEDSRAIVGTISGDTITWGTPYVVASGIIDYAAFTYYAAEEKVILISSGEFRVGTVSGTDITFGSPTATPSSSKGTLAYFPNRSKAVYIWSANGATTISFKTFTLDSSGNITLGSTVQSSVIGMILDASQNKGASFYHTGLNKFVFIGYNDNSNYIFSVVVDIDETGQLVVYTPKAIHSGRPRPSHVGAAYDPNINTYVVYWVSSNGDYGPSQVLHIKEATIDSNTYDITTGPLIVSLSNTEYGISRGLYIPEIQKTLMLFGTGGGAGRRAAVWTFTQQVTNLTAENYAGIADGVYADAATATIQTAGSVDDAQSGLTPGQAYYVQGDGTLGLNPATPSVFAGTAVSATSLLIGKEAPAATVAYADVTGTPDLSSYATETYVDTAVSNLVDTAPDALNTLNELAAALNDDADFAGTVTTSLAAKANTADLATVATTGAYADITGTPTIPADVSDLTDTTSLLGGGGGSFEAVASGSLSDGSTVVLNADGTVSVVAETTVILGAEVAATDFRSDASRTLYIPSIDKVVVIYGNTMNAVVGTVSGSNISFGTPTLLGISQLTESELFDLAYDESQSKLVVAYKSSSYIASVKIGTISGNSISFGSETNLNSSNGNLVKGIRITYDTNAGKPVVAYGHGPMKVVVLTISGTTVTLGSTISLGYYTTNIPRGMHFDSLNNKIVIMFSGASPDWQLRAIVGTVSGTNISFGAITSISTANSSWDGSVFDTNLNKVVAIYRKGSNFYGAARVGTVSGTSISFGDEIIFLSSSFFPASPGTFDSVNNKIVFTGQTSTGSQVFSGTISGSSITFDTPVVFNAHSSTSHSIAFDTIAEKVVLAYRREGDLYLGVRTFDTTPSPATNLTAENYAGIADAAYADAATATIQTAGSVDDSQSGLTPGQAYYVQEDGTLGLTPGTPSVFAGTAVSATKLLIGKEAPAADLSSYASTTYVDTAVSNLVDTAPDALNTLNELAAALNDDADFAGTVTTSLAAKANTADLATVATSGSYNDLTDQPVIAAGGGSFEAVASGALANGDIVVVNADGTVSVVGEEGVTAGFGAITSNYASAGLSSSYVVGTLGGKIVAVYKDNSNLEYGTAVVGTISGKSISFGTPVVFHTNTTYMHTVAEIKSTNKIAIFWQDLDARYAIVGSVSGSSISFGTKTTVGIGQGAASVTAWHDPISDRIGLFYRDTDAYGEVYSVSGTSITRVSTATINTQGDYSDYTNSIYDTHMNKYIVWYMYRSYTPTDTFTTRYKIVTISGNSMSVGSEQDWGTARFGHKVFGAATNNRTIFAWCNSSTSGGIGNSYLQLRIGYASGSSVSSGSTYTVSSAQTNTDPRISYDPVNNQGIIFWSQYDGSSWTGRYRTFTLTGDTTVSFGSSTLNPSSGNTWSQGALNHFYDPNIGRIVISFTNNAQIYQTTDVSETNLTAENYIGISDGAYSNGANATIQIVGSVDDAQSGLTPGQKYYVQTDGTLSTSEDVPSVFAGTAVSTTKLIVKG